MSLNTKKYNFTGKVALVTGSSSGIGAAIAIQFAQYGASLTITGRNEENLNKIAQQIEQISGTAPLKIIGDLEQEEALPKRLINETVNKFGKLDFLVNNAGGATPDGTLANVNLLEEWDSVFKLNVRSIVELTQLAVLHLQKTKGNIINISSVVAIQPAELVYSASKAALDMITKTSALELGPKGIRVNSVNPGIVRTSIARSAGQNDPNLIGKFYDLLESKSLMKQISAPEDIANLASFLASDDAKNITGSILVSDSGALVLNQKLSREDLIKELFGGQ